MKIFLLLSTSLLFLQSGFAATTFESWYQEAGGAIEKSEMSVIKETASNQVFKASLRGYDFKVDWNKELTTFYVFIEAGGERILVTTARVPTENHPENITDLNLTGGPRLTVNCLTKNLK